MSGRLLVLVLLAGCASPPFQEPGRGGLVLREELWHPFEHRAEVVGADPGLTVATGATTEPARTLWAEHQHLLYAIDLDGEPSALRALFRVAGRTRVDVDDAGAWRVSEHGAHEALRVDWSSDLVGAALAELGVTDFEPVAWFLVDDEETWRPLEIERAPSTNELVSITVAARYIVRDGDLEEGGEVTVLHVFERVED